MNLKEFLSFSKYDLPRFNTGERLTVLVTVLGRIVYGITGLTVWFLSGM